MAENKPIAATLELVYVPDVYTETERQEGASWPLGSGFYDLVVLAGDARITLHRFKAGAIDKAFALGKERKESQPAEQQQSEQQQSAAPVQQQPQTTA